jgi:hypothetical protein
VRGGGGRPPGGGGGGLRGGGGAPGGEMTQALYAHMNNKTIKNKSHAKKISPSEWILAYPILPSQPLDQAALEYDSSIFHWLLPVHVS